MDSFDIIAVMLGIWLTVRKLDAKSHDPAKHPSIARADFERWQRAAARAYGIGSYGCFFRELFHFGFMRYAAKHHLTQASYARAGFLVDVTWWVSLLACFWLARQANQLRKELGAELERRA